MEKVLIITFQKAHNYGAVLQAFALKTFLQTKNFQVSFLDYDPSFLAKNKLISVNSQRGVLFLLKTLVLDILLLFPRLQRRKGFNRFITKYLNSELKVFTEVNFEIPSNYSAIVIGSDQVWNVRLAIGVNPIYFGSFKRDSNSTKLISYAASFADFKLSDIEKASVHNALINFDAISVRENEGRDFLKKDLDISSMVVLDPVFLLSKDQWLEALPKTDTKEPKKYVLVYSIGFDIECNKLADKICHKYNLRKICLNAYLNLEVFKNRFQKASPIDFIHLFSNAEFVVTSSFHGTAFSLIFERDFYSIAHNSEKDTRQITLLGKLNLLDRLIPYNHNFDTLAVSRIGIKYDLHESIFDSKEFLQRNINEK